MRTAARFDAPFWGTLLVTVFLVCSAGCIALATAAQTGPRLEATILTTDNAPIW